MRKKDFSLELWRYIMDSSALINIQRNAGIIILKKRIGAILMPEKVAYEVAYHPMITKTDPLRQFVLENPQLITQFQNNEEDEFLQIRSQPEIDDGEAAAMAIALKRELRLVIDERNTKATGKAKNHGIKVFSSEDFIKGKT